MGGTDFLQWADPQWKCPTNSIVLFSWLDCPSGHRPPLSGSSITLRYTTAVGLLWTSEQLVAETYAWQQTTPTRDRHPWPRRDSNPQSQQPKGRRPKP